MTHDPTRDCEHGRLKGKCDVCDLQAEVERLNYEVDAIPAIKEERDALASEVLEQCRVISMGAEREDALRAELTRLKASIALDWMAKNARDLGLNYDTPLSAFVRSSDEDKAEVMERVIDKAIEAQKEKIGCVNHDCDKCKAVQEGRDWSLLAATQESLREHMAEIKRLKAAQPAPVKTYHDGKPWPVAPKPWVNLTDEEMEDLWAIHSGLPLYRAIEAKLRSKNEY
jgi:hypothetical protein